MPKVSFAFFASATLFVLSGMMLGMWMGATSNFGFAPVHAHINLIGWASMALMGGFFALAKDRAPIRLAWIIWGMMTAAVVVLAPALALVVSGNKAAMPFLVSAEFTVFGATILFLVSVLVAWRRTYARNPAPTLGALAPAE